MIPTEEIINLYHRFRQVNGLLYVLAVNREADDDEQHIPQTSDAIGPVTTPEIDDKFNEVLQKAMKDDVNYSYRDFAKEATVVQNQYAYVLVREDRKLYFKKILFDAMNVEMKDGEQVNALISETHQHQSYMAKDIFLPLMRKTISKHIYFCGSIAQGTSLRTADYDFVTNWNDLGQMQPIAYKVKEALLKQGFYAVDKGCWGTRRLSANIQLAHIECTDSDKHHYKIDLVQNSCSYDLAEKTMIVCFKERLWVIAIKCFFKRMNFIDSKKRFTSSMLVIALHSYRAETDELDRSFPGFLMHFFNFDFDVFRMTDCGREEKNQTDVAEPYEIIDCAAREFGRNFNTARATLPSVMIAAKEWMKLFAGMPSIEEALLSMY